MPKPDSLQGSLDLLVLKILSRRPRLHGYAIMSAIQDMSGAILVSSRVFQQNIRKQIQETLKLDHRVVTLYELDSELCDASC